MESNPQENRHEFSGDAQSPNCSGDPGKTRDLPKLSECQSCSLRFDACTGKNRIRLLYSEWRVLLLCKKCFRLVEGSDICSYCFKETSPREKCVRCFQCGRSVHDVCFLEYKTVPPWCYQCSGTDISVCVDCWVPKPIASKRGVLTVKRRDPILEKGSSRVSNGWDCGNLLEDDVNLDSRMSGNNVAVTRGMDLGVRRSSQANFDSSANSDESCESSRNGNGNAADGMHSSIELHSVVNDSPKVSRNFASSDSPCSSVPGARFTSKGVFRRRLSHVNNGDGFVKREVCSNGSFTENQDDDSGRNVKEKISVEDGGIKSISRFYVRTRWKYDKYKGTVLRGTRNISHSSTKGQESSATRWMNVYKRTRWKNSIRNRNLNVGLKNSESRMMEGQERCSTLSLKVFARTRLKKKSKCTQSPNSDVRNAEARLFEAEELEGQNECSDRFRNVYVRTGSNGVKCSNKESSLKDGKGSIGREENSSASFMKVYSRTRSKRGEFLQRPSCVLENPEARSSDVKETHPADVNHSCREDQDGFAEVRGEKKVEERDRYSVKYYRKLSCKSCQENKS